MGEAACRGPRERHSPGPNLALNGPAQRNDTACIVCGAWSVKRSDVRPSVCHIDRQQQRRAAGLLLSAPQAIDSRRLRSAAGAGSVALTVEG